MIELLGLPACGKSTFSSAYRKTHSGVIDPLDENVMNDSRLIQNINKIVPILSFLFLDFTTFCRLLPTVISLNYASLFERAKMFVYLYSVLGLLAKTRKQSDTKYVMYNEGLCQTLSGIEYSTVKSQSGIEKIFRMCKRYLADTIIWFPIERDIVLERLKQRSVQGGSRLQHDVLSDDLYIDKAIDCILHVKQLAEKEGIRIVEAEEFLKDHSV